MKTRDTALSKLFAVIDVKEGSWRIQTATDLFDGSTLTIPLSSHALKRYADKHFKVYEVFCAYEFGCFGFSHHGFFNSFGWRSIVANPADVIRPGKARF